MKAKNRQPGAMPKSAPPQAANQAGRAKPAPDSPGPRNNVTENGESHQKMVAMNEALLLGSLHQHELTEVAERLNAQLQAEIIERQKTARALSEKARLLDLSNDAVIVRDMSGRILYWNHGAEKLYGWSREDALGKVSHLLLKTESSTPMAQITGELHRHNFWTGELVHAKRNGQRITVLVRKALDRDALGIPTAVLQTITDITERKQAEAALGRIAVLAASNHKLELEIARRQAVEQTLSQSEQLKSHLLVEARLAQEQLRRLSHQLLSVQEEERKRISRELHDVIAQTLTSINLRLATLKNEAALNPANLDHHIALTQLQVQQSVDIVHRFARELRPSVLDDVGLIPALQAYLKGFKEETGIQVSLSAFAGVEQVHSDLRTVLYRVTQEALTNVSRHAQASGVEVSIEQLDGAVCLAVKDNGKGFPAESAFPAKKKNRLGLLGMRERVEMVGGNFAMISVTGQGSTITAQIPLGKPGKRPKVSA
jgi:PAS domain S-box-containing protein